MVVGSGGFRIPHESWPTCCTRAARCFPTLPVLPPDACWRASHAWADVSMHEWVERFNGRGTSTAFKSRASPVCSVTLHLHVGQRNLIDLILKSDPGCKIRWEHASSFSTKAPWLIVSNRSAISLKHQWKGTCERTLKWKLKKNPKKLQYQHQLDWTGHNGHCSVSFRLSNALKFPASTRYWIWSSQGVSPGSVMGVDGCERCVVSLLSAFQE